MKNIFYFLSFLVFIGTSSCSNDDGGNTKETPKSNAKAITSFEFNATDNDELDVNITAIINENDKTITADVPHDTDITVLVPTVEISPKATFTPEGAQDFTSQVTYTVTAEDGSEVDYLVNISVEPNNAKVLSFTFLADNNPALEEEVNASIDEDAKTITAEVPYGTDITSLLPDIEVSPNATFSPEGAQDFSSQVTYTVTAEDGSEVDYVVDVSVETQRAALIAIYNANPGNTLGWDLEDPDLTKWQGVTIDEDGKVIQLGLGDKELTLIPSEIALLTNLKYLFLDRNQLTAIPAEIAQLTNLERLFIDNNKITSIPVEIGQLSNLKYLYLYENQLNEIPAEIAQLVNLGYLTLGRNQLTTIPAEIGHLTNLIYLELRYNHLTTIPTEIGQLVNLEHLLLSNNELSSVPTEIGQLNKLEYLNFDYNQLTSIPGEIGQLVYLTYLGLESNQLTAIPAEIGDLSNLESLMLYSNQLTAIPTEITQLVNLTTLTLSSNQLASFPPEIIQLANLTKLDLTYNQFTSIPTEIGQLDHLTYLGLGRNQLTSVPAEIGQLINLEELILYNNPLTSIPQEICDLNINYGTIITTDEGVTCE